MKFKNDKTPKAVFFCPTKTWGGIEKNVLLRCHFLSAKGYEIVVVVLEGTFAHRFEGIKNLRVKTITKRGWRPQLFCSFKLLQSSQTSPTVYGVRRFKKRLVAGFAICLFG